MMKLAETTTHRQTLAAIDLDGTLLGPDKKISPENREAVAKLADAGLEVVLASGRHFRSMAPYALQLPEVKWIVSSQGAEVSTVDRAQVLGRSFLTGLDVIALMEEEAARGFTAVYYASEDVFSVTGKNAWLENYARLSGRTPSRVTPAAIRGMEIQKVIWMGDSPAIVALRTDEKLAENGLQGVQTEAEMYEFMPLRTTKAWALEILASHLGLTRENVLAFGDGENDIPMFDWAGLSYAMPHGWKTSLVRATHVSRSGPPETALARAVDEFLS